VILLDASGLVALLAGERGASQVADLLREEDVAIVASNLTEALDIMVRVRGERVREVEAKLVPLIETALKVRPVGETEARRAATIRVAHYQRRTSPLSLADCLLLGAAAGTDDGIATSDKLVARAARVEGIPIVALRDSTGRRP
jgi:PIN domain nuclease of toxin-antitoxin system